ncbi:AMP-binding protein [Gordonia desulfuricans]|uniref:AMP-binding protein n=1 Tax=Gordonia desulfuricans TaxID=89051 RepID=A0A7K3LQI6_9ACTN|nr:AMP-binding protein [Gordonia desulfuricans]NDK90460.1 AMP-binding protein [Gordonia desulfuricans]
MTTDAALQRLEDALTEIREVQQRNWPAQVPREVHYPIETMGLVDHLRHWAAVAGDRTAIAFYGREISYAEFDEYSDRFAGWLRDNGVAAGDRVGVHLGNCPQFSIAMLGILKAGAVHVPVNPMLREHELVHELTDADVTVILTMPALAPLVSLVRERTPLRVVATTDMSDMLTPDATGAPFPIADPSGSDWHTIMSASRAEAVATDPDALAALNYTGGTTGMPKGCEHTQRHMVYTAATATVAMGHQVGEDPLTVLVFLPVFWIAGEDFGILIPLINGGTAVLLTRWDAEVVLDAVPRHQVGAMIGTVDNYVELMDRDDFSDHDLGSLTSPLAVSFVLKLDKGIRARWRAATGATLREGAYGMTETHTADTITLGFADDDRDLDKEPVFCGLPVPGTDILIVDADGAPVPLGEEGEIILRSPSVMTGYHRNPEATAETLRGGWLHTGDVGKFSEEGAVHYLARNKEMIKTNGMSVFPSEVEALLMLHPAVERAAVVPKPDPARGQVAFAFVELVAGSAAAAEEIVAWARDNMAGYKVPEIEILDTLPMTATGKVRKGDLFSKVDAPAATAAEV